MLLLGVLTVLHAPLRAAIALSAVAPLGASPGVTVQITGSGFAPVAASNQVVLTPSTGPAVTVSGSSIVVLDAAKDLRRLAITLPSGMPIGIATVQVRNTVSGELAGGRSLQVIDVSVAQPVSALRGSTGVPVRLVGSSNTAFVAGRTTVIIGSGVTVTATQVVSPTELVATVSVSASAPIGARTITLATSTQNAVVPVGFQVVDAPPVNRNPSASANGPYSAEVAQPITFNSGGSSDPDGDTLIIAWDFGDGSTSSQANPQHAYATAGTFTARLAVSDGRGGSADATATVTVTPPPNRDPSAVASAPSAANTGDPVAFSSAGSSDPDGDPLQFAWNFGDGSSATTPNPQHAYTTPGQYTATVTVSDGRGGTSNATAAVTVTTPVTLLSFVVSPTALRFSDLNATATLLVTGRFSDGSERDLTAAATGTTYTMSAPAVATSGANGVVTSVGDGGANIVIANSGITATVPVVVEQGVALQAIELTPPIVTLRELGATAQVTLRGSFSDGSLRALTSDPGTIFSIDAAAIASVSASGLVTALAPGASTLTARNGGLSATSQVRVVVTDGSGFLRGEVFDDSRGLPLSTAMATVLIGGGTAVVAPTPVPADERGRFTLPAASGAALVMVERNGFTTVDRQANLARGSVITLLDARLTPLDGRVNVLQSVFGGEASSSDGSAVVSVPSGSLDVDTSLRVTPISPQGLQGRLPSGWSPIAAVDLQPAGRPFSQPATLRLPHADTLTQGTAVALAIYDAASHRWVVQPPGHVSDDRRTLAAPIDRTGQFAFVVPDEGPSVPPAAIPGQVLAGVAATLIPDTATATGLVLPRSAPPGDGARAVGTVILQPPAPVSSGAVLRARVSEQFDLLDSSRIVPLQFVQDVVLYGRPRAGDAGTLAGRLPITPSLQFTIQQLSLGTVRLDVTIDEPSADSSIVGNAGGSVTDAVGTVLEVPPGALPGDVAVGLLPLSAAQLSASVPDGFTLLGAVLIDLVGASFGQPVALSIPRPTGVAPGTQILVAQVITDNGGGRRLKIVGLGAISPARVSVQTTLGSLTFEGVRGGGEFAFLQPLQPLGFITGLISAPGSGAQALALVTTDTAPFAFLTTAAGAFVVAGRAGASTTVAAIEPSGATASGAAALAALNEIAALNLTLAQAAPAVTATIPAANATNVALDSPIVIDFSKPIDPVTVTGSTVVLSAGTTPVGAQPVLSANRRRLTITPASPLSGLTVYTLALTTDLRDAVGTGLAAFTPLRFTTLDPSKATVLALGVITAELPDEDGLSLVTGAAGAAEPNGVVVATNLRTQETVTILSLADGSFRLRLNVVVGDEIRLTFRDATGRESSIAIAQFTAADGSTSIGSGGGSITGPGGRIGRILPRSLAAAGIFAIETPGVMTAPALPAEFALVDRFFLRIDGAAFRSLDSLTLTESQNRFEPGTSLDTPFSSSVQLTVADDFLVTASLRFTATALDSDRARRSVTASTVVVAASPDTTAVDSAAVDQFPTVFLTTPRQAAPAQVVAVSAIAPAARIDLDIPSAGILPAGHTVLLTRLVDVSGRPMLALVDRFTVEPSGPARLRTAGRDLPGASRAGEYVVISGPLAFVTGRSSGPAARVVVDGLPFIFETAGANGTFVVAVQADAPFNLQFLSAATGAVVGTAAGNAPQAGQALDLGSPLTVAGGVLTVSTEPDAQSVVDIGTPITFRFSEALDRASVSPAAIVVTDPAGSRAYGRVTIGEDNRTVTFVPLRRWAFGTRYRYGLSPGIVAASGARLATTVAGEFTTFAPSSLGTVVAGTTFDTAVVGAIAVVGTATGVQIVNVANPSNPQVLSQLPLAGGARGVVSAPSPIVNRNGEAVSGSFVVVVSGDATTGGRLQIIDISNAAAPVVLGSAQLTATPGQLPPAGVPAVVGIPRSVVVTEDQRALVAVEGVGLVAVQLGTTMPDDPAHPGQALAARYPASGAEIVTGVAILGDRIVTAGAAGVTILDAATLTRRGRLDAGGVLEDVDVLSAFGFDTNGDGSIAGESETFDLAVATSGVESTLQFLRIPPAGDPVLISAVRLPSLSERVALDASEALAYVALGARGVALVDLMGPAAVQPVDLDRNSVDDRILGIIDTAVFAHRVTPVLSRGQGLIADGAGGINLVRLLPPRVRFSDVVRDPVTAIVGEERSILASKTAYVGDNGLRLEVNADLGADTTAVLVIEEVPLGGGGRMLAFSSGELAATLQPGMNSIPITMRGDNPAGSQVRFSVRRQTGEVVTTLGLAVVAPPSALPAPAQLLIGPSPASISGSDPDDLQLGVAGRFDGGLILNLTGAVTGTAYRILHPTVATLDTNGLIHAVAGGTTAVEAINGSSRVRTNLTVDRARALVDIVAVSEALVLRGLGAQLAVRFDGRFSDGSVEPAATIAGTTFVSSAPQVATVDGAGVVTATGAGETVVQARNSSLQASVTVHSEPRAPPSVLSIRLALPDQPVSVDDGDATIGASVVGTGSMDGLAVTFATSGVRTGQFSSVTSLGGATSVIVDQLTLAGGLTVTASVVDPATGETRSDTRTLDVAGPADAEPNNSIASAVLVSYDATVAGSVGAVDAVDIYRLSTGLSGASTALLTLPEDVDPAGLAVVARNAAGAELTRFDAAAAGDESPLIFPPGTAFVSVEALGVGGSYELDFDFDQAPIAVASVTPLSGGRGTPLTIDGTGFGVSPADVDVLFGGIRGKVVSVTPTRIEAVVPGTAADGPIRIVVRARDALGPVFTSGNGPAPPAAVTSSSSASLTVDPSTNELTLIDRLTVTVDPLARRAEIESLAARVGAAIVGVIPPLHLYVFEFAGNRSLNALQEFRTQVLLDGLVEDVSLAAFVESDSFRIDLRALAPTNPDDLNAFDQIQAFEAMDAIRSAPQFQNRNDLRTVRVAIIDDGFAPGTRASEFTSPLGPAIQEFVSGPGGFVPRPAGTQTPDGKHGTPIASILAATNNGDAAVGILNGVVKQGERPFVVDMYSVPSGVRSTYDEIKLLAAVTQVAAGNYDVVSMSFSTDPDATLFGRSRSHFLRTFRNATHTLFVSSASNFGVDARRRFPCNLSTLANVMCVGAVATATNQDGTNEVPDARAVYNDRPSPAGQRPCNPRRAVEGSNCGRPVTIAAPGEDVFSVLLGGDHGYFRATSAATPVVAGVAALVQTARPDEGTRILPDRLKSLLVSTGDNISATWNPGNMRRVNALSAVRTQIGSPRAQRIYVTDDDDSGAGVVVGIEIDPLTGDRRTAIDATLPLVVTEDQTTTVLLRPSTVVNAGETDTMYVAVETDGPLGDGVVAINTHSFRTVAFTPLNGILAGDPDAPPSAPVKFGSRRPGLAVSKDRKLLYVTTTDRLVIINTIDMVVVTDYSKLPPPYRPTAALTPAESLADRLAAITGVVPLANFPVGAAIPERSFGDLALSPDGRTLYIAVKTGSGGGLQPGFVLQVNVDLYRDASPLVPGLSSSLDQFLRPVPAMGSSAGGTPFGGDEPSAVAASPDGQHVYLVNGGLKEFVTLLPDTLDLTPYEQVANPLLIGAQLGFQGLAGLHASLRAFQELQSNLYNEMLIDLKAQANSGRTLINAAGVTDVFRPGLAPIHQWLFPSELGFGWNPPAANGGRIVNQFRFASVFAKRPFGLAIRPDGQRAIVPYFSTGNFGVLDLSSQSSFRNPTSAGLPATLFQGVVGVTPAVRLDNHLWPRRGAYTSGNGVFVPSPDESLLFPGPIEYAQNGRFTAAIHTGVNRPRVVAAPLPDFANNNQERLSLNSIGFSIAPGASSGTDPDGNPVSSLEPHLFHRGGGALTVLHDDRVGNDLSNNASVEVPSSTGGVRPYFSQNPVCQAFDPAVPGCVTEVFTRHFEYSAAGNATRFSRPRGVSIQPFVSIETPRFGDHVLTTMPVRFRWRDAGGNRFGITVHDLGTPAAPLTAPVLINAVQRTLTAAERQTQTFGRTVGSLFARGSRPVTGHNYRIRFTLFTGTGAELSATSIDVFFER